MTNPSVPAIVEWSVHREAGTDVAEVVCTDSLTQSSYHFRFPLMATASLCESLTEFMRKNPDVFRDISTRRLE